MSAAPELPDPVERAVRRAGALSTHAGRMVGGFADPLARAAALAELQRTVGWWLRDAVLEARAARRPWDEIERAVGMPRQTLDRQLGAGGRVVVPPTRGERPPE